MMDRRTILGLLAALPAAARPRHAQAQAAALAFTAIPDQDESRLVERFGRVAAYLQSALGVPVAYVPVKSYPAAQLSPHFFPFGISSLYEPTGRRLLDRHSGFVRLRSVRG
jgi:hypothetical protein